MCMWWIIFTVFGFCAEFFGFWYRFSQFSIMFTVFGVCATINNAIDGEKQNGFPHNAIYFCNWQFKTKIWNIFRALEYFSLRIFQYDFQPKNFSNFIIYSMTHRKTATLTQHRPITIRPPQGKNQKSIYRKLRFIKKCRQTGPWENLIILKSLWSRCQVWHKILF